MIRKIGAAPATSDDGYSFIESASASAAGIAATLNVLANDGKVRARSIYSLDDGQANDLLAADPVSTVTSTRDRSALGASIWINADGTIGYSTASINALVDSLDSGETLRDSFLYAVEQPNGSLLWSTVRITITGTNDAPVARIDQAGTTEDTLAHGSVATNDSDVDHGAVLKFAATNAAAGFGMAADGSWALDASNAAYQDLAAGETRQVVIGYTVTDQFGAAASSTLTVTVTGANDRPVATAATAAVQEDGSVAGRLVATDADSGDVLTYALTGSAPAGFALAADGSWTLDAGSSAFQSLAKGETLNLAIGYAATDRTGATASSTLTIVVTGTNDGPTARPGFADAAEDSLVRGSVAVDVVDVDHGAVLTYAATGSAPGFGMAADGSWQIDTSDAAYQELAAGETRQVVIGYTVSDEFGASAASTLTLTITGTNDHPVASAAIAAVQEDGSVSGRVIATDADDGDQLRFEMSGDGLAGFSLASDGGWTFQAGDPSYQSLAEGETLTLVVPFAVTDRAGSTASSTLTIVVTGANDEPSATASSAAAAEGASVAGRLVADDCDHGASLTYTVSGNAPAGFDLAADGRWTFNGDNAAYQELAGGEQRSVLVAYSVTDEHGSISLSTLDLTMTGANDAPIVPSQTAEAVEGAVATGRLSAFDPDAGSSLSFALAGETPAGLRLDADGSWILDAAHPAYHALAAGEVRQVDVPFTVTDEHGATVTSSLVITVTGANDAPTVNAAPRALATENGIAVSIDALANAGDVDAGSTLSVVGLPSALPAGVRFDLVSGRFTLDPRAYAGLAEGQTRDVTVTYGVSDGLATTPATVGWTVIGTNETPVALTKSDMMLEDTVVSGRLRATDADFGAQLTYSLVGPAPAGLTVAADGSFRFDASGAYYQHLGAGTSERLLIDWRVVDEHGAQSTATWSVVIQGRNDAPVLTGAAATLPAGYHDQAYVVSETDLLAGWSDVDGDLLSVVNLVADHGTVTQSGSSGFATYTIRPEAGYSGVLRLSYGVWDGSAYGAASQSVTLKASAQIGGATSGSVVEARKGNAGTPTAAGMLTIVDQGGDPHFRAVSSPTKTASSYGAFTVTADGAWQYVVDNGNLSVDRLDSGQTLSDSFIVYAADGTAQQIGVLIKGATDWVTFGPYDNANDPNNYDGTLGPAGSDNGNATVIGTASRDIVTGSAANQTFDMQAGDDTVYAKAGNDTVYAGFGNDYAMGQAGSDLLFGDAGNDYLYGGSGDDMLWGGDGVDQLYGGSGIDTIDGGAGRDIILGGYGLDFLTGGADGDTFIYNSVFDSGDFIKDFQLGLDGIDLRGIDANAQVAGDQAFTFSAAGAAAYSIWMVQNGTTLEIYGDTDGFAGTAEFMISLSNTSQNVELLPPNFIL